MSPRRYEMKGRRSAVAETRQRIVEATLKLHGQRGIFGTTWQDIAREADVSLGTVYKHFPTLDELVPACGDLLMLRTRPPSPESVGEIIGGAKDPRERLRRVAAELFAFYARGGRHLESDLRERELPAVREWEAHLSAMVTGFVGEALVDRHLGDEAIGQISFLFDLPTYNAMRARGIDPQTGAEIASGMTMCWIERLDRQEPEGEGGGGRTDRRSKRQASKRRK